jgi:hypothetical protein
MESDSALNHRRNPMAQLQSRPSRTTADCTTRSRGHVTLG